MELAVPSWKEGGLLLWDIAQSRLNGIVIIVVDGRGHHILQSFLANPGLGLVPRRGTNTGGKIRHFLFRLLHIGGNGLQKGRLIRLQFWLCHPIRHGLLKNSGSGGVPTLLGAVLALLESTPE